MRKVKKGGEDLSSSSRQASAKPLSDEVLLGGGKASVEICSRAVVRRCSSDAAFNGLPSE